ncbi:MAG: DUF2092 domain-containing protein [Acidobacteria bacterium]|nr:MAG: DUF2092 domain-containing protein [Acidobacteriota bacterium]
MMHTLGMKGANLVYSLVLIVGLSTGCQREQPTDNEESSSWIPAALAEEDTADPEGRDVILRLTDFMSRQKEFMTEALTTFEAVQESGQKLHFDLLQRVAVRKPGQLYWKTLRDNAKVDTAWFSDGQFTMYKEPADVWGQIRGPWNIPEMISLLRDEYNVDIPFQDLLADHPADLWLSGEDVSVMYVGEAWVEGAWTDHVAVRKPEVDFQLWIRQGPQPFLAKMVIVFTAEEGQPTYTARFRNWSLEITDAALFDFTPPEGSEQIEVARVSQE